MGILKGGILKGGLYIEWGMLSGGIYIEWGHLSGTSSLPAPCSPSPPTGRLFPHRWRPEATSAPPLSQRGCHWGVGWGERWGLGRGVRGEDERGIRGV